jgi:YbbR domain-containing protein
MQQRRRTKRQIFISNFVWLITSLALGLFVWIVAVTGDGQERRFTAIPIQVEHDEGLVIVDQQTRTTRVTVRAPQDVLGLLTAEDIVVRADLTGEGSGTHTVELEPVVSRSLVLADTQPRQITIVLEELLAQQVPITANITEPPPLNFENSQPTFSEAQVLASGPASRVQLVAAARAVFDLTGRRESLEAQVRLSPVDIDGNLVEGVTLEPQTVTALIEIRRRDGLEEVTVSPDIAINTLPNGYVISSILYDPSTVFIIGSPEALESTPNTLFTETIDLTNRRDDFEIEVPVILPGAGPDLSLVGGDTIRVSVRIDAQTTNIQLDHIRVAIVGLNDDLEADLSPEEVNALITGPLSSAFRSDERKHSCHR